jgi:MAC/Perforin domain
VQDKYTSFIKEFGTHFTTGVTLGGLAIQRTRGSATRVLQSSEAEETFKVKAGAVIEEVSAGVSVDNAMKNQQSSDKSDELEREDIELHGGTGLEINNDWIESLEAKPTIIKASFAILTELFDKKFFPNDDQIDDKATYLDLATAQWIHDCGNPGSLTAPLRYGDKLVLALPWTDGQTLQYPVIEPNSFLITYPLTRDRRQPLYDSKRSAAIILEPFDSARAGSPIMDRDTFRIKLAETNQYAGPKSSSGVEFTSSASDASLFLIRSENINVEDAANGKYFTEADKIRIMFPPDNPYGGISRFLTITASERQLIVGNFDNVGTFNLLRAEWLN